MAVALHASSHHIRATKSVFFTLTTKADGYDYRGEAEDNNAYVYAWELRYWVALLSTNRRVGL